MQATMMVQKTAEPGRGQQSSKVEKDAFSEKLTQSMTRNSSRKDDYIKDNPSPEQPLDSEEMEQKELTEEVINPEVGYFFQQPLTNAEHQLAIHFEANPVLEESAQGKSQTDNDLVQLQTTSVSSDIVEETAVQQELQMADNTNQQGTFFMNEEQATIIYKEVNGALPTEHQKQNQLVGDDESIQAKNSITTLTEKSLDGKTTIKPLLTQEESLVEQVTAEKISGGQKNSVLESESQHSINNLSTAEQGKQTPVVSATLTEISDLDIQSDLRLKLTAAKTTGNTVENLANQQTLVQKEVQLPVALISESQSVNQKVLSQAMSEVVLDHVTTLKNGEQTTARLSLTPETLGHIKIELKMIDKQLQTTIVVESIETKELLDNSMRQFTTSLAQKNIQLQEVSIQLSLPQESSFTFAESSSQQNGQQDSDQSALYFDPVEEITLSQASEEEISAAGRLSILA